MANREHPDDGHRRPTSRPPLPERSGAEPDASGMTHGQLVDALRAIDGLVDVTGGADDRPNLHLRHKPFLHFHTTSDGDLYADVKLGGGDFEPVWASTPPEREALLRRVQKHVRRVARR